MLFCRYMTRQLQRLHAECGTDAGRLSVPPIDRIISMATLAQFLSYLTFAHAAEDSKQLHVPG